MKQVIIYANSVSSEFLHNTEGWERHVLNDFDYYKQQHPDDLMELSAAFGNITYDRETFLIELHQKLTLDFDFAKDLKLFDIISPSCFVGTDNVLKELIEVMDDSLCFIVFRRNFRSTDSLFIDFEVCHEDHLTACLETLRTKGLYLK